MDLADHHGDFLLATALEQRALARFANVDRLRAQYLRE